MIFKGLHIKIENPAGSVRSGVDRVTGKPWSTKLTHDYGEIVGTNGVDGDPIDVFLGPDKSASMVYVVHQLNKNTGEWDEDKCFLGFDDAMDAKQAYYKNYDNADLFYGSIEAIPFKIFKEKVLSSNGDTMIHASITVGDPVVVDGLRGRGVIVSDDGSDVVIRYRNGEYFKRKKYNVHSFKETEYHSRYSSVKAGGPGSGRHKGSYKELYHGVNQYSDWKSIAQHGLDARRSPTGLKDNPLARVYVTTTIPAAMAYSTRDDNGNHAIVKFRVPIKEFRSKYKIDPDEKDEEGTAYRVIGPIPAKYVDSIYHYHRGFGEDDDDDSELMKITKSQGVKAGGPGSGRHKGLNRWESSEREREKARKDPRQRSLFPEKPPSRPKRKYDPNDPIYKSWGGIFDKKVDAGGPGSGRKPEEWNPMSSYPLHDPKEYDKMTDKEREHFRYGNVRSPVTHSPSERIDPRIHDEPYPQTYRTMNPKDLGDYQEKIKYMEEQGAHPFEEMEAGEEQVEMERGPITVPHGTNKRITKVGTNFCVVSDGIDKNFGCYSSREQAEAVLNGKSFIEPDIPSGLYAVNMHVSPKVSRPVQVKHAPATLPKPPAVTTIRKYSAPRVATAPKAPTAMKAPTSSGHKTLEAGGPGSGRHRTFELRPVEGMKPLQYRFHKNGNVKVRVGNKGSWVQTQYFPDYDHDKTPEKFFKDKGYGKNEYKEIDAFGDLGEPMAGALGHAHIEPEFWFHPPSLEKRNKADHIPVDDPGEKDDKFLDVTKRKQAHEDRMKRLKRSAPGGLPPYIPAQTTGLAPHEATFAPTIAGARMKFKKRKGSKLLLDTLEPRTTSLLVPHAVAYTKGKRVKTKGMFRALNAAAI